MQAQALPSIDNKSLRERVLNALRDAIVHGEFRPGQPLIETELAAQMGVSRAPLREALQILSKEGLVEVVPYHGATVRALDTRDIEELYSLRIVLETFAARLVIETDGDDAVRALRSCYAEMLAAAEAGDLTGVSRIDRRFHDTLIAMAGHKLLETTWNAVSLRVRYVMALRNRRNRDIRQIAYNHLPIIEALEARDFARVSALLEAHIASSRDLLVEGWDMMVQAASQDSAT
jgi:DNA-binding GntR family transcriptional regulator